MRVFAFSRRFTVTADDDGLTMQLVFSTGLPSKITILGPIKWTVPCELRFVCLKWTLGKRPELCDGGCRSSATHGDVCPAEGMPAPPTCDTEDLTPKAITNSDGESVTLSNQQKSAYARCRRKFAAVPALRDSICRKVGDAAPAPTPAPTPAPEKTARVTSIFDVIKNARKSWAPKKCTLTKETLKQMAADGDEEDLLKACIEETKSGGACEHNTKPVKLLQNTFFRSNALHCTATARILIPAECSAIF